MAHEINPRSRVAYVDYDPVVVAHANALLATPDQSVVVAEDIRRPRELLANPVIRGHLDFDRPVAVLVLAIFHFVPDEDDPAAIAACLREALAPGSYLVLTHICEELLPDKAAARRAMDVYEQAGEPISPRGTEQIRGFFGDFELVEPGLVPKHAWRPVTGVARPTRPTSASAESPARSPSSARAGLPGGGRPRERSRRGGWSLVTDGLSQRALNRATLARQYLISTAVLGFAASEAAGRLRQHAQAVIDEDFAVLLRWLRLAITAGE